MAFLLLVHALDLVAKMMRIDHYVGLGPCGGDKLSFHQQREKKTRRKMEERGGLHHHLLPPFSRDLGGSEGIENGGDYWS